LTKYSVYDYVLESLVYLNKKKIPMGILANWTKNLEKIIKNVGIFKYFDFVFSSSESKYSKPNPQIFSDLLSGVIKKYNKIYYVGDDYELDINSARSAGLAPILIDRKKHFSNKQGCIIINSLTSLKEIV
jgi:putative hydrolase of the HAD superfamily